MVQKIRRNTRRVMHRNFVHKNSSFDNNSSSFAKQVLYSSIIFPSIYKTSEKIIIPKCLSDKFIRQNYNCKKVNLYGGITLASTLILSSLPFFDLSDKKNSKAMLIATVGSSLFGLLDDLDNGKSECGIKTKGLKGHLCALKQGRVTTGVLKILGIGFSSFCASYAITKPSKISGAKKSMWLYDFLLNATIIASSSNLHNLFDLRPGRTMKVALFENICMLPNKKINKTALKNIFILLKAMPSDLAEVTMLGDTGANCIGASSGVCFATIRNRGIRTLIASIIVFLTLLSEKVSFSKVIESNTFLKYIDNIGRTTENVNKISNSEDEQDE